MSSTLLSSSLWGAAVGAAEAPACGIHELKVMATTWALFLDPDGTLPDEEYAERMRGIRVSRRSRRGLRRIYGDVTDDVAAQFYRLVDAHLNPRAQDRGPRFVDAASEGAPDDCVPDPRTIDQKRHDAFASILSAAARAAETPTLGGAAPTLIVTAMEQDLAEPNGVAFVESAAGPVAVPASLARHIGCHGTIHRLTVSANGAIKALQVEDRVQPLAAQGDRRPRRWLCHPGLRRSRRLVRGATSSTGRRAARPPSTTAFCSVGSSSRHRDQRMGDPHGRRHAAGATTRLGRPATTLARAQPAPAR
ncbi:DUF222 domain-containing protein [Microbacterium sp. QXD-8]|uniref:DUF222 domain-containing protein n=1 Tax=Microbacterium psychrotolerans TaxID=3068321 RepID=A0ABU0Z3Y7_9MICO|nr:DUF222 domain-containing protein [Microbacterium sp. QXD-8]MDQ7878519.1 DUF222 domain-containing protein [Microbacterium sp. QXD-8]